MVEKRGQTKGRGALPERAMLRFAAPCPHPLFSLKEDEK